MIGDTFNFKDQKMDIVDVGTLSALAGYALGYIHSNLVKNSIKKSAETWLNEAVGQAATFGLVLMDENELENREINCLASINGKAVSVVITEICESEE